MALYDAFAELYDDFFQTGAIWTSLYIGDIQFYIEEAKRVGEPVLDVSCGTGRVAIPFAQAGFEVIGLDIAEKMIEIAKQKSHIFENDRTKPLFYVGDMRQFKLNRKFPLIVASGGGFIFLETVEDQKQALAKLREHLTDDGELILDLPVQPDPPPKTELHHVVTFPHAGNMISVWRSSHWDSYRQIFSATHPIDEIAPKGVVIRRLYWNVRLRFTSCAEAQHLFENCGFEVKELFGDWKRSPFDEKSNLMVWVLKKR